MSHPPAVSVSRETLAMFANALHRGTPNGRATHPPHPLADGGTLSVKLLTDDATAAQDFPDWWGEIGYSPRGTRARPADFTGAAFKVHARSGILWCQPPAHVAQDAALLAALRERVRGFYREEWYFVGVEVVRTSAPVRGPFGGEIVETLNSALFGIESDAGDYFRDVLADLFHDVGISLEEVV